MRLRCSLTKTLTKAKQVLNDTSNFWMRRKNSLVVYQPVVFNIFPPVSIKYLRFQYREASNTANLALKERPMLKVFLSSDVIIIIYQLSWGLYFAASFFNVYEGVQFQTGECFWNNFSESPNKSMTQFLKFNKNVNRLLK